jgi:MtN3 and saliva related transmembrane protein
MFLILALGVATWIVYGFLQRDIVIILANAVSLCLLLGILYFKLREDRQVDRNSDCRSSLLLQ